MKIGRVILIQKNSLSVLGGYSCKKTGRLKLSELLFRHWRLFLEEFGVSMTEIVRMPEYFILEFSF